MFQLVFMTSRGGAFDLTNNSLYTLTHVDGLTTASTAISSVVIGGVDGDEINNIQAQPRDIILDLRVKDGQNVEDAKRAVLCIIKLKQPCALYWTQNGRTWTINGIVDAIDMPRFSAEVTLQVTIHCGVPYWRDLADTVTEISNIIPLHYFTFTAGDMLYFPEDGIPFSVYDEARLRTFINTGDVAVGMIIEILALETVTNPIITNGNGEFFGVGYTGKNYVMSAGDKLIIDTNKGQKSVYSGDASLFDYIKPRSTWLQLEAGENEFAVNSDDTSTNNMLLQITYHQQYI